MLMPFHRRPGARSPDVEFCVDGETVSAPEGEMLAASLAVGGRLHLRDSPQAATPRGAFCFAGMCQECVILVDDVLRQACLTPVRAGMRVQLRGSR
jgi:aerobic-type carbon monoxide dehydrogenase small subunit (CoxS/CutS family)